MQYVKQPEPMGCGIACLAMMLGRTYNSICDEYGRRFTDKGTNCRAITEFMQNHGYACIAKYMWSGIKGDVTPGDASKVDEWPPKLFAPIHVVEVEQSSGNWHFVLMLANGDILDPLRDGVFQLSDWPKAIGVYGFFKVT